MKPLTTHCRNTTEWETIRKLSEIWQTISEVFKIENNSNVNDFVIAVGVVRILSYAFLLQ